MISFTGISESIWHTRNNNKQKATTDRIFKLLKKDHYKDFFSDLEKKIDALVSAEML